MAKEILLYSGIYNFTAQDIIEKLDENMDEQVDLRINSGGGDVFAGWGICSKIQEHGNVNIKVDGLAASMAGVLCLFGDKVECLSVTRFMLHRASAPVETPEEKALLDSINKDLKSQMKKKIDGAKFKEVHGYTIDELFEGEETKDCWMTASVAKKIGLVDSIKKLSPEEVVAQNLFYMKVAAEHKTEEKSKNKIMTLAELKAQHPAIFEAAANEGFKLGLTEGASQEKDRIGAALVYMSIDPEGVKAIIASGKPMTQTQISEFTMKMFSKEGLEKLSASAAAPTATGAAAAPVTAEVKNPAAAVVSPEAKKFEEELMARLKLSNKPVNNVAYSKFIG